MTTFVDGPATFNYLAQLYELLENESKDGMFEGSTTKTFRQLGVSQSYYSKLYAYLYELGCIELVRRGTSHYPSQLRLIHAPTLEEFDASYLTNVKPRATLLEQRISHIEGRLPKVDLEQALAALAIRVDALESQLKKT